MSDTEQLIERACRGDREALSEVLLRCAPELRRRLAGKIAGKWRTMLEDDDVLQVTFLEAFLRIDRFRPTGPGSFLAWLGRIAENNLRDAVKELGRAKRPDPARRVGGGDGGRDSGSDASFDALVEVLGATRTTPSLVAGRGELRRLIEAALAKLPPDYARVVRLHDLEGHSAAEIAGEMGRTPGAVHMLRSRAHDALRECLGESGQFFSGGA